MTAPDAGRFRGRLADYLAWTADPASGWRDSPLFCARHWAPCPVDGKSGLLVTVLLQVELLGLMPADVGDATGINSWAANRTTPLCCELGDDKMTWLWAEIDAPHCNARPPASHRMANGRVCWYRPRHISPEHEWDRPSSVFALMPGGTPGAAA